MNEWEKKTVSVMIRIYCRSKHKNNNNLCEECSRLEAYAHLRLEKCKYGEEKPSCKQCPTHCYNPENKQKIKEVMKYSGPRMILYSPLRALKYLCKGSQKSPRS